MTTENVNTTSGGYSALYGSTLNASSTNGLVVTEETTTGQGITDDEQQDVFCDILEHLGTLNQTTVFESHSMLVYNFFHLFCFELYS